MPRGSCNPLGNYSQFWRPDSQFRIAHGYTNLTLWGQCNESIEGYKRRLCGADWYVIPNPESGRRFCQSNIQLPVSNNFSFQRNGDLRTRLSTGFEITWYADTKSNRSCGACKTSGGSCGYNISESTKTFICYCPDGTSHTEICPTNSIGHKSRLAIVIGCIIGGVALTTIAVLFLMFYAKKRRPTPGTSTSRVEKFLKENAYEMAMPTRYSHSHLKKITNNFAEKLGEGGFGVVYKGMLRNAALVAVKLLDRHRHTETQFMNEVATIGRIHHVNLVRLLGYCFENPISALVYEYMPSGSLDKILFARKEEGQVLRWEQLYSIAFGVARGIAYLHHDCEKRIIHFDIKPHNILLDAHFTPKISDFGLAKLCGKGDDHISLTATRGTPGYVAPELCHSDAGPVTDKSDVYSFGMLLLEIVGGRKNIDVQVSRSSQLYFPELAFKLIESGELGMRLRGGEMECADEEKARRLTKVGLWCIQYNSADRPCMMRVVQMLEGNGDDFANPPSPFNSSATPENPLLPSTVNSSSIEITL
eukprot:PITA_22309